MKKSLLGLLIALGAFFCGVLAAGIFRAEQKPIPKPLLEREIVDVPLFETAPINETEDVETVEESDNQFFFGWYSLNHYKNMPEVNMILLARDYEMNEDYTRSEKIAPSAGVFTYFEKYGDQGFIDDAWTKMDGNKISFKSNKIKGIEYRFEGTFLKNKTMGKEGEKLLRGTLQKFVKGKKVVEVSGDFAYYEPHCWH